MDKNELFNLNDKTAIITGGANGIVLSHLIAKAFSPIFDAVIFAAS